jgi:hypothetical protein
MQQYSVRHTTADVLPLMGVPITLNVRPVTLSRLMIEEQAKPPPAVLAKLSDIKLFEIIVTLPAR